MLEFDEEEISRAEVTQIVVRFIALVLSALAIGFVIAGAYTYTKSCSDKGGKLVKGVLGYHCMDSKK